MTDRKSTFAVWLPRVLVLLLLIHFGRGVVPFTPVEGDELGVVNGLQAWVRSSGDFSTAAYAYPIQPGSYHLLFFLSRLTHAPELAVFCVTTAVCVAGFIALASLLVGLATGLRPAWVAVALLLSEELTAAACYANTDALAGLAMMAGLLVAQRAERRGGLWIAGLLIGVGGWLRMDSLLLSPVVLVLRLAQANPGRAIRETTEIAALSGLTLLAACTACGSTLESAWKEFTGRDSFQHWQMLSVNGWLVLGYVATVVSAIGLVWLGLNRRWHLVALVMTGGLLSLAIYGGSFVSPKYLYYASPLLLLPGVVLLAALLQSSKRLPRIAAWIILALCFGEAWFGLQTGSPFRCFDPAPPWIALGTIQVGAKSIALGFGEGEILPTMDGPRLRGGQFWAPLLWRREKAAMQQELTRLDSILGTNPPGLILTSTYLSFATADGWLRGHGYRLGPRQPLPGNPSSFTIECQRAGQRLTLTHINHTPDDARAFAAWTLPGRQILFINDRGGAEFRHLAAGAAGGWQLLSPRENQLLTLYIHSSP